MEEWRDVPNFEGLYQVSSHGNVRSVDRFVVNTRGHTCSLRGCVLTKLDNGNGYKQVSMRKDRKEHKVTIHSLVMLAFVGPRPDNMHVCHNDGSRDNNHVGNLRYDTRENNEAQKDADKTRPVGEGSHYAKLSADDVYRIREMLAKCIYTHGQIAMQFGVTAGAVSCIHRRETWKHLPEIDYAGV